MIKLLEIREAKEKDFPQISKVMIPAFQDKVLEIVGDKRKAEKIIEKIIKSIKGKIFVAVLDEKIVGAIIISTSKIEFSFSTIKTCIKELGILKTIKAFRIVNNYQKSVPKIPKNEATLEAVTVLNEFQRKRIGKQLIIKAEEYLKENKFKFFGLGVKTNNKAIELYKKMNFAIISNYNNKLGSWYYMRKEL